MHIHLIGAAGTARATLAAMLQWHGHRVTGSDTGVYPSVPDRVGDRSAMHARLLEALRARDKA